jgi:hypothetical protein
MPHSRRYSSIEAKIFDSSVYREHDCIGFSECVARDRRPALQGQGRAFARARAMNRQARSASLAQRDRAPFHHRFELSLLRSAIDARALATSGASAGSVSDQRPSVSSSGAGAESSTQAVTDTRTRKPRILETADMRSFQ